MRLWLPCSQEPPPLQHLSGDGLLERPNMNAPFHTHILPPASEASSTLVVLGCFRVQTRMPTSTLTLPPASGASSTADSQRRWAAGKCDGRGSWRVYSWGQCVENEGAWCCRGRRCCSERRPPSVAEKAACHFRAVCLMHRSSSARRFGRLPGAQDKQHATFWPSLSDLFAAQNKRRVASATCRMPEQTARFMWLS